MSLKPFYVEVLITGTALVYAKSAKDAKEQLEYASVMVAGNKMRRADVVLTSKIYFTCNK